MGILGHCPASLAKVGPVIANTAMCCESSVTNRQLANGLNGLLSFQVLGGAPGTLRTLKILPADFYVVYKSLVTAPVEWLRVWIIKTRGNGILSQAFTWRCYKYQKAFLMLSVKQRGNLQLSQGDFDRRVIAVK